MTEQQIAELIEHAKVIAGTCYGVCTESDLIALITKYDPHISVRRLTGLVRELGKYVKLVSNEEKREILRRIEPEPEHKIDAGFIDNMYVVLMQKQKNPEVKAHWVAVMSKNEQYSMILKNRLHTPPWQLAEEMGVTAEQFAQLEQEMFQAYYVSSSKVRNGWY